MKRNTKNIYSEIQNIDNAFNYLIKIKDVITNKTFRINSISLDGKVTVKTVIYLRMIITHDKSRLEYRRQH